MKSFYDNDTKMTNRKGVGKKSMKLQKLISRSYLRICLSLSTLLLCSSMVLSAPAVEDETCLGCHEGQDQTLSATPHRLSAPGKLGLSGVSCVSCHEGASVHIEDPSRDNITNPATLTGYDAVTVCRECHIAHVELDNFGFDAHSDQQLNCSSCHKVHGGTAALLLDDRADFCYPCHENIKRDFSKRSNHPVKQGNLTCLSCHRFAKHQDGNLIYDLNRICQDCHPQQGGPYMYEHEPVNAYGVEGSGCVECHEPHGSSSDRLLKQKDNALCLQCHFVPRHQLAHGTAYRNHSCVTCHTDTHGSMVSNQFLDPDLPAKFGINCYQSGCHSLNK